MGRTSPTMSSGAGSMKTPRPLLESGYWRSSWATTVRMSAKAVAKETPGLRRARPNMLWQPRIFSHSPSARSVVQKSAGSEGRK